ncbi:hypothetical protein GOBAR_AA03642 [Gossypium barbadense]|uniref:Uncharacterized protein n=1 Tax=Gossypium barbadense TaxID=3634 RepID=A0A2P5YMX4_GOSBA|nr:hypothetical protein GOBAR_AA03642 [Gossypium barbadense]
MAIVIQDEEGLVAKPRPETVEIVSKNTYELCSNNNKGPIYEERRLQIKELDEWKTQKSRTPVEPKLSQDKLNTSPNQLKVGDKVLLDAADPHIATPEPNEEILLMVLSIFPYGTVEVIHPKFGTFKGISSMLSMRMIENRCGTYPLQYRLVQLTEEKDPKDITDDVPPRREDPPSQPLPPSCPVHAAASYADISERLTRFFSTLQ